jgi:acyl carrier protein
LVEENGGHRYSQRTCGPRWPPTERIFSWFKKLGRQGIPMDETEQKVIEIVSEQMGVDKSEITRETHFINDLNADSLDTVELVMEFEDAFELSIPDEEAEKIQTVGQAIDYIKEHSNK